VFAYSIFPDWADGGAADRQLQDPDVALCLLDLKMPLLDGMEVLRRHADCLEETPGHRPHCFRRQQGRH
jgi:DNA-binding response OmpR family regulator